MSKSPTLSTARRVENAFKAYKRINFLPEDVKDEADWDIPLPIGLGQTNSQPTTVRLLLTWLDPQPGDKILDVGSGSGWTTALLSHLVGKSGSVYAVEKEPDLVKFGKQNCRRLKIQNVRFFEAGAKFGLPEHAPFDRILVSAAADSIPKELVTQLKVKGKMVIPVRSSVHEVVKTEEDTFTQQEHPGFAFVPLI